MAKKKQDPYESIIIQAGVVVVMISAIVLFAVAYASYTGK